MEEWKQIYALFVVLNRTEFLPDILTAFKDIGIKGATILDSEGMEHYIFGGDSMFGELDWEEGARRRSKTIFSIVEGDDILKEASEAVSRILSDFSKPNTGIMFAFPISTIRGELFNPD